MHPRRAPRLVPLTALGLAAALLTTGLSAGAASAAPDTAQALGSVDAPASAVAQQRGTSDLTTGQKTERQTVQAEDAAAEITLSGTIALEGVDDAHPLPVGAAYSIRVENAAGDEIRTVATESSFSLTLPGDENYFLLAQVTGDSTWYPVWYGDDTPIAYEADPLADTASGLVITLPLAVAVSGGVTAAPISGVSTTALEVQAYWYEETSGVFYELDSASAAGAPGTAVPWSLAGDSAVPTGEYIFRSAEEGYPSYDDEYFSELPRATTDAVTTVPATGLTGIDFTPTGYGSTVGRIAGDDRYATGVAITTAVFDTVDVLYVASGANWPDALSAGPAAAAQGGALLLTDPDSLFDDVAGEIERLDPKRVVVVGSSLSVSDAVYAQIDAVTDAELVRIGGTDRYDTSRRIVADAFTDDSYDTVFLATGGNFPDALSVAPIAGRLKQPVLLVDGAEPALDAPTKAAIADLSPYDAQILGGFPSVSRGVQTSLENAGLVQEVDRIAGSDRHDTSRKVNDAYPPSSFTDDVFVASALGFADALAVGPAAAAIGAPLYLSESDCLPRATRIAMQSHDLDYVTLLGSERTLSAALNTLSVCG